MEFAGSLGVEDKIKCGNSWVYKFKKQNRLHKINFSSEANSILLIILSEKHLKLQEILVNYDKDDIYNIDEIGLFFQIKPNNTLSINKVSD